jgi:hypothetical protein
VQMHMLSQSLNSLSPSAVASELTMGGCGQQHDRRGPGTVVGGHLEGTGLAFTLTWVWICDDLGEAD